MRALTETLAARIEVTEGEPPPPEVVASLPAALAKGGHGPADLLAMLADERAMLLLARDGQAVLGWMVVQVFVEPLGDWLFLAHAWVFPEHRRRGVHTALIDGAECLARTLGLRGIRLWVDAAEPFWPRVLRGYDPRFVEYRKEL